MSVRVTSDTGPSFILHEPTPGSGSAVCARCVHLRTGSLSDRQFCKSWTCGAVPGKVIREAGVDPITGEDVPVLISRPRCVERNANGDCQDFDVPPAPGPGIQSTSTSGTRPDEDAKIAVDAFALVSLAVASFIVGACLGGIVVAML